MEKEQNPETEEKKNNKIKSSPSSENKEEVISFENDIKLEKWLNNNLLVN